MLYLLFTDYIHRRGIPVGIETFGENNFKLTAADLEAKITPRSKILILCYPSNPTGAIMTREDWEPIAKVVEKHDLIVISDEIYAELTYGSNHVSFPSLPGMMDRTILVSGFSKAFAMTGWRMGYACGHPDLISAMLKIHQYTVMCAPSMGQVAALEALTNGMEEKDRMADSYNQRRRLIVKGCAMPDWIAMSRRERFMLFQAFSVQVLLPSSLPSAC